MEMESDKRQHLESPLKPFTRCLLSALPSTTGHPLYLLAQGQVQLESADGKLDFRGGDKHYQGRPSTQGPMVTEEVPGRAW